MARTVDTINDPALKSYQLGYRNHILLISVFYFLLFFYFSHTNQITIESLFKFQDLKV